MASRARYREAREDTDNDTIKVSPLPEESTRVLYGMGGSAGVERKRRRREAAGSSARSIDVNNTYYYFIWIESSCFSLSLSLFSFPESAEIAGHILLRSRALNFFSNFFSQSRLYATSLLAFPVQIDYFSDLFRFCRYSSTLEKCTLSKLGLLRPSHSLFCAIKVSRKQSS